ncbi:type II toxin-antitoxin system prevent-host-death family antitoxin [Phyllobacterium zundukense]|uniref:Type II toxin-antitoxin system prevent-host-death family antitoxin n=1 Tax=Phyllobacterium zundukense TaxID=1867719 RepID=A0ACD4CVU9_9HYPH|nr:type II toxin-antitoxin system prevent-host-death family antitoxin [Phyllobacterium zundukense]UXN57716.1 type II toxin-antitoxin system prevent-host-death family antitoxin [Phyllobacterium zundukense]
MHIGAKPGVLDCPHKPDAPAHLLAELQKFCIIQNLQILEVSLKEFSFSDLSRRSGDVLDAAMTETVSLVKRGKAKVVMMPTSEYERLTGTRQEERRAFTLADAPEEDIENLMTGFQEIIDDVEQQSKE